MLTVIISIASESVKEQPESVSDWRATREWHLHSFIHMFHFNKNGGVEDEDYEFRVTHTFPTGRGVKSTSEMSWKYKAA